MLLFAVSLWSVATMLAPLAASYSTELFVASRVLVGIGEGLAPAAGLRMVATWVPEERGAHGGLWVWGIGLGHFELRLEG